MALPLQGDFQSRARPESRRPLRRAGKSSSGVVLDGHVRRRGPLPFKSPKAQVPDYGAGIRYGVLHSVLRWTRGGEVFVHKLLSERAGHAVRGAAPVVERSGAVAEIERLRSLHHAG